MSIAAGASTPGAPGSVSAVAPAAGTYPSYATTTAPVAYSTNSVRVPLPTAAVVSRPVGGSTRTGLVAVAAPVAGTATPMASLVGAPSVMRLSSTPAPMPPAAVPTPVAGAQPPHSAAAAAGLPSLPHAPPPMKLTEGIPNLESIAAQRDEYLRVLEEQERQALAALQRQRDEQVAAIRARGDQKKNAYNLEVEQQVQRHDLALSQQHGQHMMMLNQQYSSQRGILEQQANSLVMEFQHKKAHEDMLMQQYQLQRAMHDSQKRYEEEMAKIKASASPIAIPGVAMSTTTQSYQPPPVRPMNAASYTPPAVVAPLPSRSLSYVPGVVAMPSVTTMSTVPAVPTATPTATRVA